MSDLREYSLSRKGAAVLTLANLAVLAMIVVHDADHARQARNWCYTIPSHVWLINLLVYVPNGLAVVLARLRRRIAAIVTAAGGLFVAFGFAKVHLLGTSSIWGLWSKSFFQLRADALSWVVLALTAAIGLGAASVGAFVAMNEHRK
jgi:hypothetical protein